MSATIAFNVNVESAATFKPVVSLTELWMKTVENTTRDYTVNAIKVLSEKYNFPLDEAIQFLGLENTAVNRKPMTKRVKKEEESDKEESDKEEKSVKKEKKAPKEKAPKEKEVKAKLSEEEKAEKKAKLEAERAEAKKAREEKEALEKAERAEKRKAELEAIRLERQSKKEAEKAEREAKIAQEKAEREAKKAQEKLKKAEEKAAKKSNSNTPTTSPTATEEPKKKMAVSEITIDGKKYYMNKATKTIYDPTTKEAIGTYDETNKAIIEFEEEEEN